MKWNKNKSQQNKNQNKAKNNNIQTKKRQNEKFEKKIMKWTNIFMYLSKKKWRSKK